MAIRFERKELTSAACPDHRCKSRFKRKANKEVKNADDAGAAKLTSNMRTGPGTSPIPPPTSSMAATLVMIDVEEDIDAVEASLGMRGSFAALPRLMTGNAIWGTSSGIATIVATPVSSFDEVGACSIGGTYLAIEQVTIETAAVGVMVDIEDAPSSLFVIGNSPNIYLCARQ